MLQQPLGGGIGVCTRRNLEAAPGIIPFRPLIRALLEAQSGGAAKSWLDQLISALVAQGSGSSNNCPAHSVMITSTHQTATANDVIRFARIDIGIDAVVNLAALQAEVQKLTEQPWVPHVNQRDYDGEWDVLPLRCERQHSNAHPVLQAFAIEDGRQWSDLSSLQSCPMLTAVLDSLKCPLKSVRLMRLRAGAEIRPHRDIGLSIEQGEARLHLPIVMNDQVLFTVDGSRVPMTAGELWYINADRIHAVRNESAQDRINLVIDCLANDWLCSQINSASAANREGVG